MIKWFTVVTTYLAIDNIYNWKVDILYGVNKAGWQDDNSLVFYSDKIFFNWKNKSMIKCNLCLCL